jgi:hypothetical protein
MSPLHDFLSNTSASIITPSTEPEGRRQRLRRRMKGSQEGGEGKGGIERGRRRGQETRGRRCELRVRVASASGRAGSARRPGFESGTALKVR